MSLLTPVPSRPETKIGEGISTALFLLLLLFSLTGSIAAANWTDGLDSCGWAALGGVLLGILLAKLPVRGFFAHLLMLVLAIPATAALASLLLPNALTLSEKWIVILDRVQSWLNKVISGGTAGDGLIFVIQIDLLMWVMAYAAAWFVYRRHQVWGALIPTGMGLLFNLFYAVPQTGLFLLLYLLSGLLLLVRLNLTEMERRWQRAAIGYTSDIGFDFLFSGVTFALVLILIVWSVPANPPGPTWLAAFDPLQEPWENFQDQFTRMFSTLRAATRPAPSTFYGTTLAMGGPVNLGNRPVMNVQTSFGRYWRAIVFDQYTGSGWLNTRLDLANLPANDLRLDNPREYARVQVTQTIQIFLADQNILYSEAQPVRFSIPTEIRYARPVSDTRAPLDLASIRARRPLRDGDTYTAVSSVSVADEDALRHDSTQYSDWIATTYLQLPDTLPQRVRDLAKTITRDATNPYDQAAALETYLRQNIKYNDQVSAPPIGRDGVDYTLFDRKEGYCNYYASAMVVLARALGIPARVVSGYALGDLADGTYHVVEANAHSWVEVYFPNYGWIEFEPTASKPPIERPKKPDPVPTSPDANAADQVRHKREFDRFAEDQGITPGAAPVLPFTLTLDPQLIASGLGGLAALIALSAIGVIVIHRARRMARLAPAAHIYENMVRRARWLGIADAPHATPIERANAIASALPYTRATTARIATLYTRERFGAHTLDADERATLATAWRYWRGVWRGGFIALLITRAVTPPRRILHDIRNAINHWGGAVE